VDLFVSKDFRRQGIGRTLMVRAWEILRPLPPPHILSASTANIPANALYRFLGFEKVGTRHLLPPENEPEKQEYSSPAALEIAENAEKKSIR